ncbi:hypothetical protein L3Y34_019205 [Caenorhabditis briggsae]|uniref:Uncharacterized protein n=1 Tax=Caenorhabditis briggsae TaxID=6238 RepID=A0AAE9DMQ1_CAEBR|nr:hypothetical protein L3Y34_019205 [Caenorhabditis briggsae]
MPLFPILAGYCEGFLAKYFNIWTHYLIGFQLASMAFQVECLIFCFAIKHQNIARTIQHHVVSDDVYWFGVFLFIITPLIIYFVFCQAGMERENQVEFVSNHYPEYYQEFLNLKNFAIYEFNYWCLFLAIGACGGSIVCGSAFIIITIDIFRMLKNLQRTVSASNYQMYQSAVTSLLFQFATSALLLLPLVAFVVVVLTGWENTQEMADPIGTEDLKKLGDDLLGKMAEMELKQKAGEEFGHHIERLKMIPFEAKATSTAAAYKAENDKRN